jgi:hypothetical protein
VVLDGSRHGTEVAQEVRERIRERHRIDHVTVQPEAAAATVSFQPWRACWQAAPEPS